MKKPYTTPLLHPHTIAPTLMSGSEPRIKVFKGTVLDDPTQQNTLNPTITDQSSFATDDWEVL